MSGKAPPKGPRALLASLPQQAQDDGRQGHGHSHSHSQSYSSHGHRQSSNSYSHGPGHGGYGGGHYGHGHGGGGRGQGHIQSPVQGGFNVHSRHNSAASTSSVGSPAASGQNMRIGTAPPTGPRSLTNGVARANSGGSTASGAPPSGPASMRGAIVNGQTPQSSHLPQKPTTSPNANAAGEPGPSTLLNKMNATTPQNGTIAPGGTRAVISFSMPPRKVQQAMNKSNSQPPPPPPEPSYEPPPPPPPSGPPPPGPSNQSPPPPPSGLPPKPTSISSPPPPPPLDDVSSQPIPPAPLSAPPSLPPPPISDPPPPPPSSAPPPPPPPTEPLSAPPPPPSSEPPSEPPPPPSSQPPSEPPPPSSTPPPPPQPASEPPPIPPPSVTLPTHQTISIALPQPIKPVAATPLQEQMQTSKAKSLPLDAVSSSAGSSAISTPELHSTLRPGVSLGLPSGSGSTIHFSLPAKPSVSSSQTSVLSSSQPSGSGSGSRSHPPEPRGSPPPPPPPPSLPPPPVPPPDDSHAPSSSPPVFTAQAGPSRPPPSASPSSSSSLHISTSSSIAPSSSSSSTSYSSSWPSSLPPRPPSSSHIHAFPSSIPAHSSIGPSRSLTPQQGTAIRPPTPSEPSTSSSHQAQSSQSQPLPPPPPPKPKPVALPPPPPLPSWPPPRSEYSTEFGRTYKVVSDATLPFVLPFSVEKGDREREAKEAYREREREARNEREKEKEMLRRECVKPGTKGKRPDRMEDEKSDETGLGLLLGSVARRVKGPDYYEVLFAAIKEQREKEKGKGKEKEKESVGMDVDMDEKQEKESVGMDVDMDEKQEKDEKREEGDKMDVDSEGQGEGASRGDPEEEKKKDSAEKEKEKQEEEEWKAKERAKEMRTQGKGKGKEILLRYEGEVLCDGEWVWVPEKALGSGSGSGSGPFSASLANGTAPTVSTSTANEDPLSPVGDDEEKGYWVIEKKPVPQDPRKPNMSGAGSRKLRTTFYETKYDYDPEFSTGPPPSTCVLITNVGILAQTRLLREHFSQYGTHVGFEPQISKENGSPLGVLFIRFSSHEEAKKCVEKENGKKRPWGGGVRTGEGEEIGAVLDPEGLICKAATKELELRRKREKLGPNAALNAGSGAKSAGLMTPSTVVSVGQTPVHPSNPSHTTPAGSQSWKSGQSSQSSSTAVAHGQSPLPQQPSQSTSSQPQTVNVRPLHHLPLKPTFAPSTSPHPQNGATPSHPSSSTPLRSNPNLPPRVSNGIPTKPMNHPLPPNPRAATMLTSNPTIHAEPMISVRKMPPLLAKARATVKKLGPVDGGDSTPMPVDGPKSTEKEHDRDKEGRRGEKSRSRTRSRSRSRERKGRDNDRDWDRGRSWRGRRSLSRSRSRDRDKYRSSHYRDRSRDNDRYHRARSPRDRSRDRGRRSYGGYVTKYMQRRLAGSSRSSRSSSRSPSPSGPIMPKSWEKSEDEVVAELMKNGMDHLKVEGEGGGQLPRNIREDEVLEFFSTFPVDKVLKSSKGLYVTFTASDTARRAERWVTSLKPQLAFRPVTAIVKQAPKTKTTWDDDEMLEQAQHILIKDLKRTLEADIMQSVVVATMGRLVEENRSVGDKLQAPERSTQSKSSQGLSGLSFKKQKKKVVEVVPEVSEVVLEEEDQGHEEVKEKEEEEEPAKKKRKKEPLKKKAKKIVEEEFEVESEDDGTVAGAEDVVSKKRPLSAELEPEGEEPVKKKPKREALDVKKKKKEPKTKKKAAKKGQAVDVILPDDMDYDIPAVVQLQVAGMDSSLSPSRESSPVSRRLTTPPPTPPPVEFGICDDDEDLYYAKLALLGAEPQPESEPAEPEPVDSNLPSARRHLTGSARSEGYYKITHAEKAAYVAQYQARNTNKVVAKDPVEEPTNQAVTSSRSNRANARRRAQGLEEINMVQRAVALSKGETANELSFKFNQLQTRKKHLRFARSPIHDWGLYAMERISRGEMVIEYVGEVIRAQVADKREKTYERQGIGSSYLFRIDEDLVVDATKKGNLGRLINHSCDPNCTAKIITISGEKKIVIYAKQDIELGDEITYDYHFPFEQDKIPCLCGSAKCRGFLN